MVDSYWSRLLAEMTSRGLGMPQMAKKLGVSYQAIKKVKDGGALGRVNNSKAAKILGINPDWLATGKGPKELPAATASPGGEPSDGKAMSVGPALHMLAAEMERLDPGARATVAVLLQSMASNPSSAASAITAMETVLGGSQGQLPTAAQGGKK